MNIFKTYYMWWAQSLTGQGFWYSKWKTTTHTFKGRTHKEAISKMNKFLSSANITGRFICLEAGIEPSHN